MRAFVATTHPNTPSSVLCPNHLFTFAAPAVGPQSFAWYHSLLDMNGPADVRRYTTTNDIIPRLPPARFGYVHGIRERYIDRHSRVVQSPWTSARIYDGLVDRFKTKTWFDSTAAHAVDNYAAKLTTAGE